MISYIELQNFKSFSNIVFDLRGTRGIPKKLAFLYGENGSGKSSLIRSLMFICQSFDTITNQRKMLELEVDTNLDSLNDDQLKKLLFSKFISKTLFSLQTLIQQNRSIGEASPMVIKIGFRHKGRDGFYLVKLNTKENSESVLQEQLYYKLNDRAGFIFDICGSKDRYLSPSIFTDAKYESELLDQIQKYWGRHTFISILFNEMRTKNQQYFKAKLAPSLHAVLKLFSGISTLYKGGNGEAGRICIPLKFLQQLDRGEIERKDNPELLAVEKFLNQCYTQLYSDIKRAYYKLKKIDSGYQYELYFDKICFGKEIAVPISMESTGTKKLLDLFPLIFVSSLGGTVFADEIDSGIHDLLMQDIVKVLQASLEDSEEGQFIATTHNTLLLDNLRPENIYVLRSDVLGNKKISCVTDFGRAHKNNSIRHRYLKGVYQGVPEIGYLDFKELAFDVMEQVVKLNSGVTDEQDEK